MPRTKQTARGPFSGPASGRQNSRDTSSFSSSIATPNNEYISSTSSESGSLEPSHRELPDELIEFVSQEYNVSEPPRKRQKVERTSSLSKDPELEHIVVHQSRWEIQCTGSKLSELHTPMERSDIRPYVYLAQHWGPSYIEITDDTKQQVFHTTIPPKEALQDVHLALLVDQESRKWARLQGRLWTEFGISLYQKHGLDCIELIFTIKWNTTTSPYNVLPAASKTQALLKVMATYFPDPNVAQAQKWSPQDFYQSVHSTDKNDGSSISMKTEELKSELYPFQKRAVQWLLRKEGVEWSVSGAVRDASPLSDNALPNSFIRAADAFGRPCYVSHLFGTVTLDLGPFMASEHQLKGGILAEEMGLGKTVEMISLITLHKRSRDSLTTVFDHFTGRDVQKTAATLIITPPSILQQWISEVDRHAPHLKVLHYEGIKPKSKVKASDLLNNLATSDIVISTYSVLAAEINFTQLNPTKQLRNESKYPRPKSPIMQLSWWRILLDEAQMVESGVSKAAVVARMIPRENAWCVTGTPVRKDVNDLLGLLIFLRYEPYASTKHIWSSLISSHKNEFRRLFGSLALRHSKQSVRDELKLPAQRRYVITMPFTPIEQHYQELFNRMCEEVGLDVQGAPLLDTWDPDEVSDVMRRWLVRLRQTVLHPEVGGRNRRALGQKDGPLRTVDQVLDVMMDQTDVSIRTDQRALLTSRLRRGQLFENSPRVQEALDIWEEVVTEARIIVEECRAQLREEQTKVSADIKSLANRSGQVSGEDSGEEEQEEIDPTSRLGVFRMRLRGALEIEHMATFFRANAYFQIKSNEDMTKPDTPEFQALEKLETEGYEEAKKLRREILQEIYRKADKLMRTVSKRAAAQTFVQIPEFPSNPPKGGLESRRIMEQLDILAIALDAQANKLDEWREMTIQFLLRPLVDEDEGIEITGDEYEESTKTQDEVMVYVQALRAAIADRHDALTGQENQLVAYETKTALHFAKDGEGAFPEKTLELLNARAQLKPTKEKGSIRGIVAELRALATSLRPDAENGSMRAQNELSIVEKQLNATQKQFSKQTKVTTALEKEVELFTNVMNTRLEYYRQLQFISDTVAPYEGPNTERILAKMMEEEEKLSRKIATSKSKRKYLDHLRMEATNQQEQRICVICREPFEIGALTVCGHQYCKECIHLWWREKKTCPICKRKLIQADLHEITYKPQELTIEAEEVHEVHERSSPSSTSRKSAIYSEISKSKLAEIKNIELDGPSFTTKVDTLARHLMWLRETDPGAKSIIYSQFKDFLDVLARAFQRFRIGFSSIDKPNGIERFKNDPGIECFLLHARAHSSGLNLVNASHVFLCEPLLNTALELQAMYVSEENPFPISDCLMIFSRDNVHSGNISIEQLLTPPLRSARVDRIGQHQETNVWLYLVDGTVEESIHQLSVRRRMEHIGQRLHTGKGKEKELSAGELLDTNLEEANSMELQQVSLTGLLAKGGKGGEMIEKEDLWDCLFGGIGQRNIRTLDNNDLRLDDPEVRRHLAAEAAEDRLATA